ncbi:hypothetical protein [Burkholderia ubonensis]|uniref:hypothetical protein n=1 Tax=Burkholderia ubonensis TaxID=101571 RepID=UPI0012FC9779|nr:hypothetical protein [Burkholderia ubonensis]
MTIASTTTISPGSPHKSGGATADGGRISLPVRVSACVLALAATATSAWISYLAGMERGDWMAEKIVWVAIGVVLMLSAHLIPALTRVVGRSARLAAMMVWSLAIVATGYTHATFFVNAQRHAGEARAARIVDTQTAQVPPSLDGRPIEQVANERAKVQRDLATAGIVRCLHDCAAVAARKAGLAARLAALNIELEAAQRRIRFADAAAVERARALARQDAAIADPVVSRLAPLMNVGTGTLDLVLALALGWLIEAIACISWLVALRMPAISSICVDRVGERSPSESRSACTDLVHDATVGLNVLAEAVAPCDVVAANDSSTASESAVEQTHTCGHLQDSDGCLQLAIPFHEERLDTASELERLARAIREGSVRPTIASIRSYVGCTEGRALALRRQLAVLNPELLSQRISPAA